MVGVAWCVHHSGSHSGYLATTAEERMCNV